MATSQRQDFMRLRSLKQKAEAAGTAKSKADEAFKTHQARLLSRLAAEETDTYGGGGWLFSVVTKVKGQVQDRKRFVKWALKQDEGVQEFLQDMIDLVLSEGVTESAAADLVDQFYDAVMNTSLISYKPDTTELNRIANNHVDNGEPLPPGVQWRPDSYISQRKR